jgi:hypothetical protein
MRFTESDSRPIHAFEIEFTSHGSSLSTDEILKTWDGAKSALQCFLPFLFSCMYLLLAAVPAVLPQAAGRLFALFALFVSFNGYYAVDVGSSRKCAMHGRKSRRFFERDY